MSQNNYQNWVRSSLMKPMRNIISSLNLILKKELEKFMYDQFVDLQILFPTVLISPQSDFWFKFCQTEIAKQQGTIDNNFRHWWWPLLCSTIVAGYQLTINHRPTIDGTLSATNVRSYLQPRLGFKMMMWHLKSNISGYLLF